jgi:hypothetical protein
MTLSCTCELNFFDIAVRLEVDQCRPDPWLAEPVASPFRRRTVVVAGRVIEFLQGEETLRRDPTFEITVAQQECLCRGADGDWNPWSMASLSPGNQFLAFCKRPSVSSGLSQTLHEECGLLVRIPDPAYPFALEGARLGARIKRHGSYPGILATVPFQEDLFRHRTQLGPLMSRLLVDGAAALDQELYAAFLYRLIEAPDIPMLSRSVLLRWAAEEIHRDKGVPLERRARLVRAMVGILQEPYASTLRLQEGIRQVYLRNVIFTMSGRPRLTAAQVWPDPDLRQRLISVISGPDFSEDTLLQLHSWLRHEILHDGLPRC